MKAVLGCIAFQAVIIVFAPAVLAAPGESKDERDGNAIQVAAAWFNSLMQGETAVTTTLSAVPFSFDKKKEIRTYSELKRRYDQVVESKGKRDLKPTSVKIESSSADRVEVVLMIGDERVSVVVKPAETYRVVGFWD